MEPTRWGGTQKLAWTTHDGVAPPPSGVSTWGLVAVATAMTGVWVGLMSTEALCPEHRAWVQGLASLALIGSVASVIGLLGRRWWGPVAAMVAASLGVAIGLLDAVHSANRGGLIALGFALVAVALAFVSLPQLRSARWAASTARELRDERIDLSANDHPQPVAEPHGSETHTVTTPSAEAPAPSAPSLD